MWLCFMGKIESMNKNLALCGTPLFPAADSGQDIAVDMKKQSSPQSIRVREMIRPVKRR